MPALLPANGPNWGDYLQIIGFVVVIVIALIQITRHRSDQKKQHTDNLKIQIYENMIRDMQGVSFSDLANTFDLLAYEIEHAVKEKILNHSITFCRRLIWKHTTRSS